ncbi:MAG: T9SS type A sorting domain-containing protein [Candidatus Electryonea clarkiae]|nr:T9SS type A sorting domain-containing protein [Candidatus Electryonea clarkiae]MDP8286155.1 T9SS type A sorting domain-containing protein [Candidatus Electryonea clarkiae]
MRHVSFIIIFTVITNIQVSAHQDTLWTRTFGGVENDYGHSIQHTDDGGYIIVGQTWSFGVGERNVWLIKIDSTGIEEWTQTFGGIYRDVGADVQQTIDGGYIITGYTVSYGAGQYDVWLIKTDSDGEEEWNQTFGGTDYDEGRSVQQTNDSGYIIAGYTESFSAVASDVWLIKTDSCGNELWNQTFGGVAYHRGYSVQQTNDSGYIISGETRSINAGQSDIWLIKTDSTGEEEWNQTFGGEDSYEYGYCVKQTIDDGYIITGFINARGAVNDYAWLIKTDSEGEEEWNQTLGGGAGDACFDVLQTTDGGYIITGDTESFGAGEHDLWLIKTDSTGNQEWIQIFGGIADDYGNSIQLTNNGGYVVLGGTSSYGAGDYDVWLICHDGNVQPSVFTLIIPFHEAVLELEEPFEVNFAWEASVDPDQGDSVLYDLQIHAIMDDLDSTIYFAAQTDTHFIMTIDEDLGLEYWDRPIVIDWHVDAISGDDTTNCIQDFTFQVSPHSEMREGAESGIPTIFEIVEVHPNPFNPSTTIRLGLPYGSEINVSVYNTVGQQIAQLAAGSYNAGYHNIIFDASELSSGIYFVHATVPGKMNEIRKIVLMK